LNQAITNGYASFRKYILAIKIVSRCALDGDMGHCGSNALPIKKGADFRPRLLKF
jgi:hypothetical protein